MPPKIAAEFTITGTSVLPDEITKALGVTPSSTWRMSDTHIPVLQRKHNGWCISTGYQKDFDLEKYARQVLDVLLPKSETITTFCQNNGLDCELSLIAYVIDETPSTTFGKELVSDLAKLNASLDIDIILTTG